jgi:TM2 domain-containing membrane protein YozV
MMIANSVNCFAVEKSVLSEIPQKDSVKYYNPFITAPLSIVPGGGQIYTKHFTRGFLFLGTDGIIGWISLNYWKNYHKSFNKIYSLNDSLNMAKFGTFTAKDTMRFTNKIKLAEYDNIAGKVRYYNASALFAAVGIWNIIDGFGVSNRFYGVENKNPRTAMALSAIPFSGAGQFYNGEWFKAGLTIATQTAFVFGGVQYQYLMKKSQDFVGHLSRDSTFQELSKEDRIDAWQNRYKDAAKRRTMFFWYSIIFYIYGMTDAYVDASLSKFENKFDISADFSPENNEIACRFVLKF